jgi:hypothetical protein
MSKFSVIVPRFPGHIYSHSLDEVAETVHYGLLAIGHDSVLFPELDVLQDSSRRHIILGAHLLGEQLAYVPEDAILYNLEQTTAPWVPQQAEIFRRFTVWDYSPENVKFWLFNHGMPSKHVPIGYVPELTRIASASVQDIDVLFYGHPNERRDKIIAELCMRHLNVAALSDVFGTERDIFIGQAKVVLNMHYYTPGIFEIARVSYLLANRKYVVSEWSADVPYGLKDAVDFTDYPELAEYCALRCEDTYHREAQAENGFELFKLFDERDILRKALAE